MSESLIRKKNFCLHFYHEAQTPEASEGIILQVKKDLRFYNYKSLKLQNIKRMITWNLFVSNIILRYHK